MKTRKQIKILKDRIKKLGYNIDITKKNTSYYYLWSVKLDKNGKEAKVYGDLKTILKLLREV